MKKTFVNPEMNISLFDMENVLTESGGNNMEDAKKAIAAKATNGETVAITAIDFTF